MASVLRKDPDRRPVRMETGVILGLFTEKEKTGKDWICLTAFGSEIVRKEIERQFRLSVKRIPLSVDAFSVDIQTMEWFADILV